MGFILAGWMLPALGSARSRRTDRSPPRGGPSGRGVGGHPHLAHYAPLMSWLLIVALLLVFVIRTWSSMMSRQRLRAGTGADNSARITAAPPATPPAAASKPVGTASGQATAGERRPRATDIEPGPELVGQVRALMESGFEAGAVRLLCDELGVGIVEAQRTARALSGLPMS
jgi:hypothetical protein